MVLDLNKLDEQHRRWIDLGGALAGVEVEIRHVGPREQERFRQRLVRAGVLKQSAEGHNINSGREVEFFYQYAKQYITDWRGPIKLGDEENPTYSPEQMGRVLGAYGVAFEQVTKAVLEEVDFFSSNGSGSTG
jgi:hypothetical protein